MVGFRYALLVFLYCYARRVGGSINYLNNTSFFGVLYDRRVPTFYVASGLLRLRPRVPRVDSYFNRRGFRVSLNSLFSNFPRSPYYPTRRDFFVLSSGFHGASTNFCYFMRTISLICFHFYGGRVRVIQRLFRVVYRFFALVFRGAYVFRRGGSTLYRG